MKTLLARFILAIIVSTAFLHLNAHAQTAVGPDALGIEYDVKATGQFYQTLPLDQYTTERDEELWFRFDSAAKHCRLDCAAQGRCQSWGVDVTEYRTGNPCKATWIIPGTCLKSAQHQKIPERGVCKLKDTPLSGRFPGMTGESRGERPDFKFEYNYDRPGNDYHKFKVSSGNASVCLNACNEDTNCKSWTLVKAGLQGNIQFVT